MAGGRGFWGWYAEVSDDVRQKVVEEGWSGQRGGWTSSIDEKDMPGMAAEEHKGTVWANETVVNAHSQDPSPMAGIGTMGDERSNWETVQEAAQAEAPSRETAIANDDLYGRDPGASQDAANVWGRAPEAEIAPSEREREPEL